MLKTSKFILLLAISAALVTPLRAIERHFTYTYEAATLPKGTLEIENWATWKTRPHGHNDTDEFDFRHEFEYGVTDHLQASLYVADWSLTDDPQHNRSARYHDTAVEVIYNLTNPVTDFLGSAIYGEVQVGDHFVELEGKLLLQKNFGPWVVAYNAALEAQWEGSHLDEHNGEFSQALGISYEVIPQFSVGAELLHEVDIPNWKKSEPSVLYAGPNASFRSGNWYATVTPLIQLTDRQDEFDLQTRVIVGVHF